MNPRFEPCRAVTPRHRASNSSLLRIRFSDRRDECSPKRSRSRASRRRSRKPSCTGVPLDLHAMSDGAFPQAPDGAIGSLRRLKRPVDEGHRALRPAMTDGSPIRPARRNCRGFRHVEAGSLASVPVITASAPDGALHRSGTKPSQVDQPRTRTPGARRQSSPVTLMCPRVTTVKSVPARQSPQGERAHSWPDSAPGVGTPGIAHTGFTGGGWRKTPS